MTHTSNRRFFLALAAVVCCVVSALATVSTMQQAHATSVAWSSSNSH